MARLLECVPNFSEGRDRGVIDAIAQALSSVSGVKLLDVDPGADTNRTVYTLVGPPEGVAEAAFRGARKAADVIDMTVHKGAHPRMGALDVCPFIPVAGITMAECAELARSVGRRIGDELQIPVYFYEHAASHRGAAQPREHPRGRVRRPRRQAGPAGMGAGCRTRPIQRTLGRDCGRRP